MSTDASRSVETSETYIIQGGVEGFDRLKVLSRVMHPTTTAAFDRIGVRPGLDCLDVGSGSGDVAMELGRRVGPSGSVLGIDRDDLKLERAGREAEARGLSHVAFRHGDVTALESTATFDLIYVRFVLTHVTDPAALVASLCLRLRPGAVMLVEDIDSSGALCYPPHPAHDRYAELYCRTAADRGVDPNIGPRLPGLLQAAGLRRVCAHAVQPLAVVGETKLIPPITMHAIAPAVLSAGHATADEVTHLVAALTALAADSTTFMGMPRVVQAWGFAPLAP